MTDYVGWELVEHVSKNRHIWPLNGLKTFSGMVIPSISFTSCAGKYDGFAKLKTYAVSADQVCQFNIHFLFELYNRF